MENFSSYGFIIAASFIIIISYFYNLIAKKTNVPSVLLLILTGILINQGLKILGAKQIDLFPVLEVLGIVGLIMIVLEAALDLKITKNKWPIIYKSFLIALLSLIITSLLVSVIIRIYVSVDFFIAIIYAIPLSIMSSAIIIPSVSNLDEQKKEFMIYEGTFSDILGIMFFYFMLQSVESDGALDVSLSIIGNISITIAISILISYLLVFVFQNIKTEVKLFLLISVLTLLYSLGKMFHLSSLLIILVFGLLLENRHIFFFGPLKKYLKEDQIKGIFANFKLITIESSFIVRTFFFVIFGATITLSSLLSFKVLFVSIFILGIIYGIRFLAFKFLLKGNHSQKIMIAPRGLITILLFFAIPEEFKVAEFDSGVLLLTIIISSLVMSWALIKYSTKQTKLKPSEEQTPIENTSEPVTELSNNSKSIK